MLITPASISALNTDFKGQFQQAFKAATPKYKMISTEIPSTTGQNTYGFIDEFPTIREWLGDRVLQGLKGKSLTVINRDFEGTVALPKNDVEDDKMGFWDAKNEMLGQQAAYFPDTLVIDTLVSGFTTNSYDGKKFFAHDHAWKDEEWDNLFNLALDPDNFQTALEALVLMAGGGQSPIITTDFKVTLVHGPKLMGTAKQIVKMQYNEFGASNLHLDEAELFMHPRITDEKWILMISSVPLKPVLFQRRTNPRYVGPNDFPEELNKRKRLIFGVDFRCEAALSLWQLAVGSTG